MASSNEEGASTSNGGIWKISKHSGQEKLADSYPGVKRRRKAIKKLRPVHKPVPLSKKEMQNLSILTGAAF